MDKVVHFEIPVDDAARAREFYGSAFDWDLTEMDMGGGNMYTTVRPPPSTRRHSSRPNPAPSTAVS